MTFSEYLGVKHLKSQFGIEVTTATSFDSHMNKGGRKDVPVNPYYGRITKISTYTNIRVGISYENAINGQREREGLDTDFQSSALKGKHHIEGLALLESDKECGKYYLPLMFRPDGSTKTSISYLLDGEPISEKRLESLIATWKKQQRTNVGANQGVANVVLYIAPTLDNVKTIRLASSK